MFSAAPAKSPSRSSTEYGTVPESGQRGPNDEEQAILAKGKHHFKGLDASESTVVFGIVFFAFCSGSLLVTNKVALHLLPYPSFLLLCQFLTSTLVVQVLAVASPEMEIEGLKWSKVRPFAAASFVFFVCLLTNVEALKIVNVDLIIVVRSCSPIAVAALERVALGRPLPSLSGMASLLLITAGAALYFVTNNSGTSSDRVGYAWVAGYFVSIAIEMVWVKFVVDTVPMTTWTRVYYNNVLSIPLVLLSAQIMGEEMVPTASHEWSIGAVCAYSLACVTGVAISWAGFNLRRLVSATSFTVIGVICKLLSVLVNDMMWSKHSNLFGHGGLLICILAGVAYEKVKSN